MSLTATTTANVPNPHAAGPLQVGADRVTLLIDGEQTYPAMLEAIAAARRSVCLETYILRDDFTGQRFAAALVDRARAGVEVNVLYDAWGSSLRDDYLDQLHEAGVRTVAFRPLKLKGRLGRWFAHLRRRNHRKVLVVDGSIGFTGGLNIADDYASVGDGGQGWRDTHVRLEGPSAQALQALFLRTWLKNAGAPTTIVHAARSDDRRSDAGGTTPVADASANVTTQRPEPAAVEPTSAPDAGRPMTTVAMTRAARMKRILAGRSKSPANTPPVAVIASGFWNDGRRIRALYLDAVRSAQTRIQVTSAYFLPPRRFLRALAHAARRGVDVALITAGDTDVPLVKYAARGVYGPLLRAGVRIYEYEGRVLHAKTAVFDGRMSTVGSSNLDTLSLQVNLEVNVTLRSVEFAQALEAQFERDRLHAREITRADHARRSWVERAVSAFALLFREWL